MYGDEILKNKITQNKLNNQINDFKKFLSEEETINESLKMSLNENDEKLKNLLKENE